MKKSNVWVVFWSLVGLAAWAGVIAVALRPAPPAWHPPAVRVAVAPLPPAPAPEQPTLEGEKPIPQIAGMPGLPPSAIPSPKQAAPKLAPGHAPEIALVIDDMGLDMKDSARAETSLPPQVTLSYMPYADDLAEQTGKALAAGHELLLHMPMEPIGHQDPGPSALLTSLAPDQIRARFDKALGSFKGFDGVNNHEGSKFTADAAGMQIVAEELKKRGLFFLDSRTGPHSVGESVAKKDGVLALGRDVFLDDSLDPAAIETQLQRTEYVARRHGEAIAIGHPHAATLDVLEKWIPEAEKDGYVLVPLHDLLEARIIPVKAN
ncbi:MAG TPA: divergent polysaccharide deacetylase family protein [Alphaproteobacteria bacterium]|nr:divergent polysaccharide deacetylase family protein [Alphaproteobacteria bacterium]